MLIKCRRSCNLCGDLVSQKDRIQSTTRRSAISRPAEFYQFFSSTTQTTPTTTRRQPDTTTRNYYVNHQASEEDDDDTHDLYLINGFNNQQQKPTTRPTTTRRAAAAADDSQCVDKAGHCKDLAERGDCVSNKETMKYYCSKSCSFC